MKLSLALLASVAALLACASGQRQSWGQMDINDYLRNPGYVMQQIRCVQDLGKCDTLGGNLKVAIPEVLDNQCRRCTEKQRQNANKLINYLRANHPSDWEKIQAKYKGRRAG